MIQKVDRLRAEDVAYYSELAPGERLRMALEMMLDGFALQRANLRRRYPAAPGEEIETMLRAWMLRE